MDLTFGLINAEFTDHAVSPTLYRDMAKPGSYNRMVDYSYAITSVIYITVAASGYLMFGSETLQEVGNSHILFDIKKFIILRETFS